MHGIFLLLFAPVLLHAETLMHGIFLLLFAPVLLHAETLIADPEWELIGSRTYTWKGEEILRCRHWDKVAVRWHLSSCGKRGNRRTCTGGANEDMATVSQNHTELPRWHNAFTYVQMEKEEGQTLKLAMTGYDKKMAKLISITPLRIDVDWKWTVGADGCNNFSVRMSAMSTIQKHRLGELEEFCTKFDRDQFVKCNNL